MANADGVNDRDFFDFAGCFGVALWSEPLERTAAMAEDGVEENTEPS